MQNLTSAPIYVSLFLLSHRPRRSRTYLDSINIVLSTYLPKEITHLGLKRLNVSELFWDLEILEDLSAIELLERVLMVVTGF